MRVRVKGQPSELHTSDSLMRLMKLATSCWLYAARAKSVCVCWFTCFYHIDSEHEGIFRTNIAFLDALVFFKCKFSPVFLAFVRVFSVLVAAAPPAAAATAADVCSTASVWDVAAAFGATAAVAVIAAVVFLVFRLV